MSNEVVKVKAEHIEPGIVKYKGRPDAHLNAILTKAGYEYTVYRFADNRILLVLPGQIAAFLYANEQVLFDKLSLV